MKILAFDTCFNACSVAVGDIGRANFGSDAPYRALTTPMAAHYEAREKGHAEALFPMIAAALDEAGLTMSEIDLIAATRGPGSFTGTRTSVAAARGFAVARDVRVVAATSLHVMAAGASRRTRCAPDDGPPDPSLIVVAVDARRERIYVECFTDPVTRPSQSRPRILTLAEAVDTILHVSRTAVPPLAADTIVVVGSAAEAVACGLRAKAMAVRVAYPNLQPDARDLIDLVAANEVSRERHVAPLYLRPPDAKPQASKVLARLSSLSSVDAN